MSTYFGILDLDTYDIRNGYVSKDAAKLLDNVTFDIVEVTNDDYILEHLQEMGAPFDAPNLEADLFVLNNHGFEIIEIPKVVYDYIKDKDCAVVSTEKQYIYDRSIDFEYKPVTQEQLIELCKSSDLYH